MKRIVSSLFVLVAGCATGRGGLQAPGSRLQAEPEPIAQADPKPGARSPEPGASPGVIPRAQLEKFLAQSPGVFLSHVDTAPAFEGRRFSGWRIGAFFPGDPLLAGALHAGDVVTRVNGHSVEQPEQFMQVWEGARFRRDLTVDIVRDGRPRTLSWPIVD